MYTPLHPFWARKRFYRLLIWDRWARQFLQPFFLPIHTCTEFAKSSQTSEQTCVPSVNIPHQFSNSICSGAETVFHAHKGDIYFFCTNVSVESIRFGSRLRFPSVLIKLVLLNVTSMSFSQVVAVDCNEEHNQDLAAVRPAHTGWGGRKKCNKWNTLFANCSVHTALQTRSEDLQANFMQKISFQVLCELGIFPHHLFHRCACQRWGVLPRSERWRGHDTGRDARGKANYDVKLFVVTTALELHTACLATCDATSCAQMGQDPFLCVAHRVLLPVWIRP